MRIMGVDPGGKTGVMVVDWDEKEVDKGFEIGYCSVFRGGGVLRNEEKTVGDLCDLCVRGEVDVCVIEDFVLRLPAKSAKREGISPARIGFALYVALRRAGKEAVIQDQGCLSVFSERRDLERLGLWVQGKDYEHVRDAGRHVAMYVRRVS